MLAAAQAVWRAVRDDTRFARDGNLRRFRIEAFGAIVQTVWPRALVFVDRAAAQATLRTLPPAQAKRLQHAAVNAWTAPEARSVLGTRTAGVLSAPLEAHLQLTNACEVGCKGCYTGANPQASDEWQLAAWQRAIDELAAAGVFHVALGGGESATLPWLGELAAYCWSRGIVPNLTTSGLAGLAALLPIAHHFGQINVSLDGLGTTYQEVRGVDGFARAVHAILALRARKREVGINVVVTRQNFHQLEQIVAFAKHARLSEVEILRFKPAGRGAKHYAAMRCTHAQHLLLVPTLLRLAKRYRIRIKIDCSYFPMLAAHQPKPQTLAALAVYGCTGGDFLVGAKAQGQLTACSFAGPPPALATEAAQDRGPARPRIDELRAYWQAPGAFGAFRTWAQAQEPCQSCSYLAMCRGGCRVVAGHAGDWAAPDPECPRVVAFRNATPAKAPRDFAHSTTAARTAAARVRLPVI